jgi:hypothetical protein
MKNKILSMALVALVTAIIAFVGVVVGTNLGRNNNTQGLAPGPAAFGTPEAMPFEEPKSISVPGYAQIVMKSGDLIQFLELHNPAENPCYFVIAVIMPDGTEVFRSGLIEPGQKLDAIKLSQLLNPGTYKNAVLRYSCYSLKDKAPMNGADIKFTLEVV